MHGKVILSSVLVAAGAALAVGGPAVFAAGAEFTWRYLHLLLFGAAGLALLLRTVPLRTLAAPAVLALLGLVVLLVRSQGLAVTGRLVGAAALVAIGLTVALLPRGKRALTLDKRRWALFSVRSGQSTQAPRRIRLVTFCGQMDVDLSHARTDHQTIQLFISNWFGQTHVTVPPHWATVAGRVTATRLTNLNGELDSDHGFLDPEGEHDRTRLAEVRRKTNSKAVAIVHVLGFWGTVSLTRPGS